MGLFDGLLNGQSRFLVGQEPTGFITIPQMQKGYGSGRRGSSYKGGTKQKAIEAEGIQSQFNPWRLAQEDIKRERETVINKAYTEGSGKTQEEFQPILAQLSKDLSDINLKEVYTDLYKNQMDIDTESRKTYEALVGTEKAGGSYVLVDDGKGGFDRVATVDETTQQPKWLTHDLNISNIKQDRGNPNRRPYYEDPETGKIKYAPPQQFPIHTVDKPGSFIDRIDTLMDDAQDATSVTGWTESGASAIEKFVKKDFTKKSNKEALYNMSRDIWDQISADPNIKKDAYNSFYRAYDEGWRPTEALAKEYMDGKGIKKPEDLKRKDLVRMYALDIAAGNMPGRTEHGILSRKKFDTAGFTANQGGYLGYFEGQHPEVNTTEPTKVGATVYVKDSSGNLRPKDVSSLKSWINPGITYKNANIAIAKSPGGGIPIHEDIVVIDGITQDALNYKNAGAVITGYTGFTAEQVVPTDRIASGEIPDPNNEVAVQIAKSERLQQVLTQDLETIKKDPELKSKVTEWQQQLKDRGLSGSELKTELKGMVKEELNRLVEQKQRLDEAAQKGVGLFNLGAGKTTKSNKYSQPSSDKELETYIGDEVTIRVPEENIDLITETEIHYLPEEEGRSGTDQSLAEEKWIRVDANNNPDDSGDFYIRTAIIPRTYAQSKWMGNFQKAMEDENLRRAQVYQQQINQLESQVEELATH